MDVLQHPYYRLNKTMMTLIGQWPYHRTRANRVLTVLLILLGTCDIFFRIAAVVKYRDDWRILMDCTQPILIDALFATMLFGFINNSQNTLQLLNRIRTDWQVWARDQEICILHEYAMQGKQMTTVYAAVMFAGVTIVMAEPVVPKIIDVLLRNGTALGKVPFPIVFYHLDEQKYYFYISAYCYVCSCVLTLVVVTNGVMFISYVYHGSGIFAALGHKLERIGNDETSAEKGKNAYERHERDMLHIASCIDRHNNAIDFVNLIDAAYTCTFFVNIGLGMTLLNVTGLEILRSKSDLENSIRFTFMSCNILLNFYADCYFAQILMDHSINIHFSIYNNQWYKVSAKAQKLLQFMSMRSRVPCELTVGKMYAMSVTTYVLVVRKMISYLTFSRSLTRI